MYMKQILIELDDRSARELERIAPARQRKRAEFIRRAIRVALDAAREAKTQAAYRTRPVSSKVTAADLQGWDSANELAVVGARARRPRRQKATRR
jgi:metal-responsive CopG/Arc/MetJ family transcriptional regulator